MWTLNTKQITAKTSRAALLKEKANLERELASLSGAQPGVYAFA